MKNNLLAKLGVASIALGAIACNPQESLMTPGADQENVIPSQSLSELPTSFIMGGVSRAAGQETDDVTVDYANINVHVSQNGVAARGYSYDPVNQLLKDIPYGYNDFYADYPAVIPAGHEVAVGEPIHIDQLSEYNGEAVLDYMREQREPIVNFLSGTQSQDVNSATVLDPFVMMPQNGRIAVGIAFESPNENWRLGAEFTVYNKQGKKIGKVEGIPVENQMPNDIFAIGFDFTDVEAVTGAFVVIKIEVVEVNSQGERTGEFHQWTLDGHKDKTFSIENGLSKGFVFDIDEKFTPSFQDLTSEFEFVQLVIDDEVVELD
ncbi:MULTISPECIES: hypothetical protein [Flammeovirga]|uniref:Uncharacterized protein n=1 Tax=Flammeovirga agarivorans TaxID=2726742 RepID=A0A7X8SP80_9BACT|nr:MULTISPECIES: hypothetical protein [Flammeovirga]NLR93868.1 hypothetical protein [Flammeovirga agarivorans]